MSIIGLDEKLQAIYGGSDERLALAMPDDDGYQYYEDLTQKEKAEIADLMIKRWQAFKDKVLNSENK